MHRILTEHPAVVEIDELRQQAKVDRDQAEADSKEEWDKYREAGALAARSGAPMPPAPDRHAGWAGIDYHERTTSLSRQRDQVITDNAPDMVEQMRTRERELLDEAGPIVARMDEIADELGDLIRTATTVARSTGQRGTLDIYGLTTVDPGVLFLAVERGWSFITDPIAPAPRTRAPGMYAPTDAAVIR